MPHKRAKRSLREKERLHKGEDLAPRNSQLSTESIPKSMTRVLNAMEVRQEFRKRKNEDREGGVKKKRRRRETEEEKDVTKAENLKQRMVILPGESLKHFNQRVEDQMRPLVHSAVQASSALQRKSRNEELQAKASRSMSGKPSSKTKTEDEEAEVSKTVKPSSPTKTEFTVISTSAPRRLNDIAQAPPQFTRLPKIRKISNTTSIEKQKSEGVVSMAQKKMMEEEREKAIRRYREMKETKLRGDGRLWIDQKGGDMQDLEASR